MLTAVVLAAAVYYFWEVRKKPLVCTMEAKLCSDGSYVGRVPPKCDFAPCPKEDLIQVESPRAREKISSPLVIKGKARGFWFFEASFPIKLFDGNGNLLAATAAQAQDEWMTNEFVPFRAELKFTSPQTEKGTLVFERDNPAGLPEGAEELRMPVVFAQEIRKVKLYYYNPEKDKDEMGNVKCSRDGLAAVEGKISITQTPIQDTIKLLLKGKENLGPEDVTRGLTTEYPLPEFSLKSASLRDGILTLEFDDPQRKTIGGACRVGILWFQIEATAKQYPGIKKIQFLPETLFQP